MAPFRFLLLLSPLLLFSCNKQQSETSSAPPSDHEHIAQVEAVQLTTETEAAKQATATFVLDTTGLSPEPDTPLKLLLEGTFHKGEVWRGAEKRQWLGLYHKNGDYVLRPASLQVKTVEDPVVDNEGVLSGRKVVAADANALFLLTGMDNIKAGEIDTAVISRTTLAANKDLKYSFKGRDYFIQSYGDSTQSSTGEYSYRNYGWKAVGRKGGKKIEQTLAEDESFDDSIYVLLWAGDLDRDGIPDLLLDLANHYNVSRYTLFLSSKAEHGKLYRKAAVFEAVGC
ncbi:hypothetical protein ACFS7Z_11555 [Pontibacter toksunensis]|uniref:Lipoprotein n=1 Tax=Pontibacter toksunensis TaxID=1332631 RepID=A0ABW6BVK9_9BACT